MLEKFPILRSKIFWSLVILVVLLRTLTPEFFLRQTNRFLADFSPAIAGHLEDMDISLFRGAYVLEGLEFHLKENENSDHSFFKAERIDVSLAWRELWNGRFITDIDADKLDLILTDSVLDVFAKGSKGQEASDKAGQKLFPVEIERLRLSQSSFEFTDLLKDPPMSRFRLTDISGQVLNMTPRPRHPETTVQVRGHLFGDADINLNAQVLPLQKPRAWNADIVMKNFNLPKANPFLKRKLPLTLTSGSADVYAELRSRPDGFEGYVKPFLKKADIVSEAETFLGLKHFGIEVTTAAVNLFLRTAKEKTVATKVEFSKGKDGFKINSSKALSKAFKNGFSEEIPEGLDNQISLGPSRTKIH